MTRLSTTRRAFLRGAAGTALALPFFRSIAAKGAGPTVPKRLIVWFTPCGWEAGGYPTSLDLEGTSMAPLAPYASDLIVTRGLSIRSAYGQSGADHPTGFGHILTGNHCSISTDDILRASNASIDQVAASRMGLTRRASSLHGIHSSRTMSYDDSGNPVRPENSPRVAFDRLFGDFSAPAETSEPQPSGDVRRRSILDTVRGSYERARCQLGGEDRVRLDAHLDQIRDIEERLGTVGAPSSSCEVPTLGSAGNGQQIGRLHMDILVRAMACDITRVGTVQWYSHTGVYGQRYDWGGLPSHHEASHNDGHAAHDRAFAGELAYLLEQLRTTEAEDGMPLLYHTAVLCVSELGLNSRLHHLADLGIVVAGQAGGAFRTGQYIDFLADRRGTFERAPDWKRQHSPGEYFTDFDVPHNRLLTEVINAVSDPELEPLGHFGTTDLPGGLPELRA